MTRSQTSSRRLLLFFLGLLIVAVLAPVAPELLNRYLGPAGIINCIFNECAPAIQLTKISDSGFIVSGTSLSQITGSLYVHPTNPRYFTDDGKRAILLTGSHTWTNLQDSGETDPPETFDYGDYLDFLEGNNHNFLRLWHWEQSKWGPWLPANEDIYFHPLIYQRTGPGTALDGKPRFDVSKFNQAYFDLLRQRVIEAGKRGVFVSIMLFDGWSIEDKDLGAGNPWQGHPFNKDNNINSIDGDPNNDGNGHEVHTLAVSAITSLQKLYVQKVIETVNDLDNVLYEISNESHENSQDWQYHMINFIKDIEAGLPKQHPAGMTVEWPSGNNSDLFSSPADWISPNSSGGYKADPPSADGKKVIINDTDHLWGIGGNRRWVWQSFTRGHNPIFMDPYNCSPVMPPDNCAPNKPEWVNLRINMGYALSYANRMNLAAMTPRGDLCSTKYCLANPTSTSAEYLIYQPNNSGFSVDLSDTSGQLLVEWLNPGTGEIFDAGSVTGGEERSFIAPFSGDSVLYLYHDSLVNPTLSIEKSGPIVAKEDTPIVYSLSIANSGNVDATNLVITDEIPDGATYVSGGKLSGSTVTWNVSKLAANSSTAVHFTVKASDTIVNSEYRVTADGGYKATGSKPVTTLIVSHFKYLPMMISMAGD